jgi:hypothetical protein
MFDLAQFITELLNSQCKKLTCQRETHTQETFVNKSRRVILNIQNRKRKIQSSVSKPNNAKTIRLAIKLQSVHRLLPYTDYEIDEKGR